MFSKIYLLFISVGSILSWLAWFFVVWNIDPTESKIVGILFFYSSLSMAIGSTYLLVVFLIGYLILKRKDNFLEFFKKNISQAFIVTLVCILVLLLFHLKLVVWWNASLLILSVIVLKICFSFNQKYAQQTHR